MVDPTRISFVTVLVSAALLAGCSSSALPPPERECAADEDCEIFYEMYVADGACCMSCKAAVGNKQWHDSYLDQCLAMGTEGCPKKKCVELGAVKCVRGTCTAVPGS